MRSHHDLLVNFPPYSPIVSVPYVEPDINLACCAQNILARVHPSRAQDIATVLANIVLLSIISEKEILQKILTDCRENWGLLFDSKFVFHTGGNLSTWLPRGHWVAHDGSTYGNGILTLIRRVTGCQDDETIQHLAGLYGKSFSDKSVRQLSSCDQSELVHNAHSYFPAFDESIMYRMFGKPHRQYGYYNEYGKLFCVLNEWKSSRGLFRLFCTMQQNKSTGLRDWEFFAPSASSMIYNRHLIAWYPGATVVIYDKIDRIDLESIDYTSSVPTWAGLAAYFHDMDWECMKGRTVVYNFESCNQESFRVGAKIIDKLGHLGCKLSLVQAGQQVFGTQIPPTTITFEKFYDQAKRSYGLDLRPKAHASNLTVRTLRDIVNTVPEDDWQITQFCKAGHLVCVLAAAKTGKTWFALDLALAIATGEAVGRLSANGEGKALYFGTEMTETDTLLRVKSLLVNYLDQKAAADNFNYISLFDPDRKFDLSTPEDQRVIENTITKIGGAFVVFDNLGGLIRYGSERNDAEWEKVSRFFQSLTRRGITVILVHHLTKGGDHRGTGKIIDDVDLAVYLNRPDECSDTSTTVEVRFEYSRHLKGEEKSPFTIEYIAEGNVTRRIVRDLDGNDLSMPMITVTQEEIERHNLAALQVEILNVARMTGAKGVKAGHFKTGEPGRSDSNVTDHLKALCDKELLVKHGSGSASRYYTPENVVQSHDDLMEE